MVLGNVCGDSAECRHWIRIHATAASGDAERDLRNVSCEAGLLTVYVLDYRPLSSPEKITLRL